MYYSEYSKEQLIAEQESLKAAYKKFLDMGLRLDMSRGKPSSDQLDISVHMLDIINSEHDCKSKTGLDCRNYGLLEGLPSCRELFAKFMQVKPEEVMIGGNSSLNMMFDTIATFMYTPVCEGAKPWLFEEKRKFLCPVPGYDRHFGVTEYFGFEMIPVPMTEAGPDMDMIESLVEADDTIKGIWCVPKYSNPQGYTYSDETVKRFAALKPKAKDFRIMWDDAYCIHDLADEGDTLISLMDECRKTGNTELPIIFCSTSKITFPGSGVAAMAAGEKTMEVIHRRFQSQTIGHDKINMLRHMAFFKDMDGVKAHMQKHKEILKPRFDVVLKKLDAKLADKGIANWCNPKGGYFVSVDVMEGTAAKVVRMCKNAGLVLTSAGATYPGGNDPKDSNIRIAPSFPPVSELEVAMDVFCVCARLAAVEEFLAKVQ